MKDSANFYFTNQVSKTFAELLPLITNHIFNSEMHGKCNFKIANIIYFKQKKLHAIKTFTIGHVIKLMPIL